MSHVQCLHMHACSCSARVATLALVLEQPLMELMHYLLTCWMYNANSMFADVTARSVFSHAEAHAQANTARGDPASQ